MISWQQTTTKKTVKRIFIYFDTWNVNVPVFKTIWATSDCNYAHVKLIKGYKHRELGLPVPSKAVLLITNPCWRRLYIWFIVICHMLEKCFTPTKRVVVTGQLPAAASWRGIYPGGLRSSTLDEQRRTLTVRGRGSQWRCEDKQRLGSTTSSFTRSSNGGLISSKCNLQQPSTRAFLFPFP